MSAAYWVLVSDGLIAAGPRWPAGLRHIRQGQWMPPGAHWHLLEDDDAPPELDRQRVELVFRLEDGVLVIAERRVLT